MKFGVSLFPLRPERMVDVAVAAEELGYDSLWLGEHVISPDVIESVYPYAPQSADAPTFHSRLPFYDPYAALSFLAAKTSTVSLVIGVSIVPLHDPYHLARSVATIDQFSGGRFRFGVGAGWLKEEFDLVGATWERRGARMEEMLELMVRLWNDESAEFHGEFYDLPPSGMEPKPITRPHPPFIFGGMSPIAYDRTVRLGDGWMGVGLDTDRAIAAITELRRRRADSARSADELEFTCAWREPPPAADVERLADAGLNRIVIRPWNKGRDAVAGITRCADLIGALQ